MAIRRKMTARKVEARRRVVTYKTVTKTVLQCERPYVLFGEAIAEARHALGLTQQELADKVGLVRASIANIEVGRQRVLLSDVFDFAKALKMDPVALFKACADWPFRRTRA